MDDIVRVTLDTRILELLDKLESFDGDSEEYKAITENIETLYQLRNEETKLANDREQIDNDITIRVRQMHQVDKVRNRIELVKTILTTTAGTLGVVMIIAAEETGTVRSKALGLVTSFFKFKG